MAKLIYLDNAATTQVYPEVLDAMLPYFTENYGNASSIYEVGQRSKEAITTAREDIAKVLGAKTEEIYFTAGGSEADNWALKAAFEAYSKKGNHIITTKIEHHAILHSAEYLEKRGYEVTYLDVDEYGVVKLDDLKAAIRPDTILISVMFANNEIGTIQPIKPQIQRRTRSRMLFHISKIDEQLTDKENVIPLKPSLLPVSARHPLFEVVLVTEFVCIEDGIPERNRELLAKRQYRTSEVRQQMATIMWHPWRGLEAYKLRADEEPTFRILRRGDEPSNMISDWGLRSQKMKTLDRVACAIERGGATWL